MTTSSTPLQARGIRTKDPIRVMGNMVINATLLVAAIGRHDWNQR